ncbi:hypothetical protein [Streptomyces griseorubiginosus]|uniref:hypothetical protein n=1 Tax=Streptomyces griseorubiginosus TaxID=67304 RepID=UPI0036E75410
MTDVIAGQSVSLLSQWYDQQGGTLTDLDATPSIAVTSIATGATALAATTTGVTHPAAGSYGYVWTPASSLTPGAYLATWTGLASGSPVTATETVTVYAPASAAATNTSPDGIWYATREAVKAELDVRETARSNARVDRALEDASRAIEGLCHRTFAPVQATRYFDWPPRAGSTPWILRLNDQELISVASLASGGVTLTGDEYLLEPVNYGPPYNRVEVNLGTDGSFGGGDTYQRDVQIAGLWGYRNTETSVGALAEILDDSETAIDVDGATSATVGVGSILRIDSERLLVKERTLLDTGQTLGGAGLTAQNNSVTVTVQNGTAITAGEIVLVDGEKLRVDEVAGNTLVVTRAWDGSTIAAHTAGTAIYAPRTLTVTRGALGTTAAAHASASTVYRWDAPGPVRQLCIAEALTDLLQGRSGYARTAGSGESERETTGKSLQDLRDRVYVSHGRKARLRSV